MNHSDFKQLFFGNKYSFPQTWHISGLNSYKEEGNSTVCLVKDGKHLTMQFKCLFINTPKSNLLFTNVNISIFSRQ